MGDASAFNDRAAKVSSTPAMAFVTIRQRNEMRRLRAAGLSCRKISLSIRSQAEPQTVWRHVRDVPAPRLKGGRPPVIDAVRAQELREQRLTLADIAERLGGSMRSVGRALKRAERRADEIDRRAA